MTLALYDRVQETTTTSGTGSVTLAGAAAGFQSFAVVGDGNTCYYTIVNNTAWEVGIGTYSTTGPTLARTTVLSNSNNDTNPISLSGASSVFLTYPAEKSVNLDASGNVSALGTISSGTWQGSTIAVAYGGTGVTASSGANSVVLRDANQNVQANKFVPAFAAIVSSGGTSVLTASSAYYQRINGTQTQTIQMPDATTLAVGTTFAIDNDSTQDVTITNGATTIIDTTASGSFAYMYLIDNSTVAGTWARYHYLPNSYDFGTNSAVFGGATISNAIWNGTAVGTAYGGTGLSGATPFTSGGAVYANSASTLTSGTLPVTAGGTGIASLTSGYIPYGNGTSGYNSSSSLQFNGTYLVVGGTTPLSGATNPITAFSSSANNYIQTYTYNASNGVSASADFVAYANNSTDAHGWADMGFTSSTYADPVYTVTGPNEAYILGSAPSGSGATGNLVYATDSTGTANAHQWYVGGFTQLKSAWKMQLTSTGLQLANALGVAYGGSGATTAQGAMNTFAGAVTSGSYLRGNGTNVVMSTIQAADVPTLNQNTTGQAGSVANALTFATSGGVAAGSTYNGGAARTIDYSSVGAQATLVSGTNIKTVNGTSLLGSGDLAVSATPGGATTQVQYNNAGAFAGSSTFTFNSATGTVTATTFSGALSGNATTASNVSSISNAVGSSYVWTGVQYLTSTNNTASSAGDAKLQVYAQSNGGAVMSFHRPGLYATNLGLDSDNVIRIGGWSAPANVLQLDMSGNLTMLGTVTASSDETLKTNWRDLPADFIERLATVKHGTYDRTDVELTQDGVSAQSLQGLMPNSVAPDASGKLSVAYGNAALVAAIKLAERVVELEARLAKLEK